MIGFIAALNSTAAPSLNIDSLIGALITNPNAVVVTAIEFLLGLALGYVAMRALKYLLASVGIILLGIVLGVWSLGNSVYDAFKTLAGVAHSVWSIVYSLVTALGILVIAPVTVGFIVGALIAHVRK
ncbi:MAG: hypothetical protein GXO32_01985 [Crenarchaeota archaeon]|nr:hypothetical protein [Thermoproteota archaeon]